jgi:type IV pilus assembly protein PilV
MKTHKPIAFSRNALGRHKGLSILEVLIALAVLSIGLAGLAIMHMNSLQYIHSAYYRSLASAIALDFEERLWLELADEAVVDCPDLTTDGGAFNALIADWRDRSVVGDDFPGFGASNLAKIRNLTVEIGGASGDTFTQVPVTLTWTEGRFDDNESIVDESDRTESYLYNVRLLCKESTVGSL